MKNIPVPFIIAIIAVSIGFPVLPSVANAQDGSGKIISKIDFDPASDGFSFRNYAGSRSEDVPELTAADMVLMFGADKVCIEGTANGCVLYQTAERWMEGRIQALRGGHCDGFSVSAMRTWLKAPFKGKAAPRDWRRDADVTSKLEIDDGLANYLAYFHSLQGLQEVNAFRAESFKFPPTKIVNLLIESFQTRKDYYTLGVGMRVNGKYTNGHSILPIAVEDMGNQVFRIHVYDSNYPSETKYVMVDGKTESWRYHTASDPTQGADDYFGDRKSETLSLKRLSDRNLTRYKCPFSSGTSTSEGSVGGLGSNESITFSLYGEGDLLITDPNGKQIGYDSKGRAEINQIPGAEIVHHDGGFELGYAPEYVLPYDSKAKNPYRVTISGKDLELGVDAELQISAPGFVVGFDEISLDPDEELTFSISPDGETLTFLASADGEAPTIYVTTEDGPDRPSYSFEVGGVSIDGGKQLTMTADPEAGKIFFKDNDSNEDAYDIELERTDAKGKTTRFRRDDVNLKGSDSFEIDIEEWDDEHLPVILDDDDGDGFADEGFGDEDLEVVDGDDPPASGGSAAPTADTAATSTAAPPRRRRSAVDVEVTTEESEE